ncbi:MAG: type II toxin-antitoxin system VapC family toxin [Vicinamibacterales bacterium]
MILLDTHIWVWWANSTADLRPNHLASINDHLATGLFVSVISVWEVAKLMEKGRLKLDRPVDEWIEAAILLPGVVLQPLTPTIAVAACQLPPPFHADPADQILVATARELNVPILAVMPSLA